ncbi:MAG: GtrA family protein [Alphaproteobacteria bacterium]|nr:GtrA family protein [Alphaproteobacteria bacterium]
MVKGLFFRTYSRLLDIQLPFIKVKLSHELIKFLFAGVTNNLIVIAIYEILLFYIDYKIASIIGYVIGFFLVLYTSTIFVFKTGKACLVKKIKFLGLYIANSIIYYNLLIILKEYLEISPRISIFFIAFFGAMINFMVSKRILKNPI